MTKTVQLHSWFCNHCVLYTLPTLCIPQAKIFTSNARSYHIYLQ